MAKYEHIFFDLDRTLWDFNRNSSETLKEISSKFELQERFNISHDQFVSVYFRINESMWERFRNNAITKEVMRATRFKEALFELGASDQQLADQVSHYYQHQCPKKTHLLPGTQEVLKKLSSNNRLHIITNGFAEAQHVKLDNTAIRGFFSEIIISEEVGAKKPHREIFDLAMQRAGSKPENSLMIGDDLDVDVKGASEVGMDQVFFNPSGNRHEHNATYEITSLHDLINISNGNY